MGSGAHAGHLAGQDAERHGAETPHGHVLGGTQSRGRETPGSSIRKLRGGACVILAESSSPPSLLLVSGHREYNSGENWDSKRFPRYSVRSGGIPLWLQKEEMKE